MLDYENQNNFSHGFKISIFLNIILSLMIIFSLILLVKEKIYSKNIFQNIQPSPIPITENTVKETDLPINWDILKNPIVYQWRGSVEGNLVGKDSTSLTLEKNNQKITIAINQKATSFFGPKNQKGIRSNMKFADLQTGSFLRGEFWVLPVKNKIEGSLFMLE